MIEPTSPMREGPWREESRARRATRPRGRRAGPGTRTARAAEARTTVRAPSNATFFASSAPGPQPGPHSQVRCRRGD